MVFVGNGGTKQGHDAVTEHLVDGALEAVHRVHHQMDSRIEELLRSLGIEPTDEFGRVLEISKEDRDLLAFTGETTAGGQDFLREVWGHGGEGLGCLRYLNHPHQP